MTKSWRIEIRTVKAMATSGALIRAQVDGTVASVQGRDDGPATTTLEFDEDTARVLSLLLKAQLAAFDARKAKSRRG